MPDTLLETPLRSWHEAHGGRMVPFAGWALPVQYTSIVDEHLATRRACGLFDVSHMGRLAVAGPAALDWLDALLTRRVADLPVGRARYTLVTAPAPDPVGYRVLDDALVTRVADAADGTPRLALVVNASNRAGVVTWLRGRLPATGVVLDDRTAETAMIAVQGPQAVAIVGGLCPADDAARIAALPNYRATTATVAGRPAAVSRTGYTGEDGLELVVERAAALPVWEAIAAAGGGRGLLPCGLGARDTLRLEAGMPLYGHELLPDSDPFALGLGLAVDLLDAAGRPREFPGAAMLRQQREAPSARVRVGLAFASKRAAREGSVVRGAGAAADAPVVGVVTSGSFAPSLGHAVAMALVDRAVAVPGTALDVVVRDAVQPAHVAPLPFYRRRAPRT